jgi:hypothetical protein
MKVKRGLALIGIVFLLIGTSFASSFGVKTKSNRLITTKAPYNGPELKDNAFQYNGEETWIEWWFFTLYDEEKDIQLCFSYSILLNETSGLAIMMVIGFDKDKKYDIRNYYEISDFYACYEKPNVSIGKDCSIKAIDENTFNIRGKTQNGKITWNFTYNRLIKPYQHSGDFGWLCYMPSAEVEGIADIDGISYNISGYGYHDHNWMAITEGLLTQWRWAETYDVNNNISIIFSLAGNWFFTGDLAVIIGEETIIFENPKISYKKFIVNLTVSQQQLILSIYPRVWHIKADNGKYLADITVNVNKNNPLYLGGLTYMVNEQVSEFSGEIKSKDATYVFNAQGFSEYTRFSIFDFFLQFIY